VRFATRRRDARTGAGLLLALGVQVWACDSHVEPPELTGILVVSTTTSGEDPDQDGFLVAVGAVDSLRLQPAGSVEVELDPGRYTVRLFGVAAQCSVAPAGELEVEVTPQNRTVVAFEISCPATGARVMVTTIGSDIDADGYRVAVDGNVVAAMDPNDTLLAKLDPGSRTVELTGLAPNCAVEDPEPRVVTIVEREVVPIEFAVVCTATTGVIAVVLSGGANATLFEATIDGGKSFPVAASRPTYVRGVSGGDHLVSLNAPFNCSIDTSPQSVTLATGGIRPDTVEVTFTVVCQTVLRIMTVTTGPIPTRKYVVWQCGLDVYYCYYGLRTRLGSVAANDTLVVQVDPGTFRLLLTDFPSGCQVSRNPTEPIAIAAGGTRDVTFRLLCAP
jgi:hypothetical protein